MFVEANGPRMGVNPFLTVDWMIHPSAVRLYQSVIIGQVEGRG